MIIVVFLVVYNFNKKVCTYSSKNGHTIEVCYKKHGYPPGHKFFNKITQVQCYSRWWFLQKQEIDDNGNDMRITTQQYCALMDLVQ